MRQELQDGCYYKRRWRIRVYIQDEEGYIESERRLFDFETDGLSPGDLGGYGLEIFITKYCNKN